MSDRNLRLARQLSFTVGSGFALALLLIGALTVLNLRQLAAANVRMEAIVQEHVVKGQLANRMRDILRDRAVSMLSIVVMQDPFERDQEMLRFYEYGTAYQKVRLELGTLVRHDAERQALDSIDRMTRLNRPVMVRTVHLGMEGHTQEALDLLQQQALPLQRQLVAELDHLVQVQRDKIRAAAADASQDNARTRALTLFLGLLAAVLAALTAAAVVRRTSHLAAVSEHEGTKFQTLFETNTDGIVILDGNGFIDCNSATLKMFGMTDKAAFLACHPGDLGQALQACGTPAAQLAQTHIHTAMQRGHDFFDWIARRPDGSTFPMHLALHAMTLDGRRVVQAIMRDISVQKETEETLMRARDEALSATQMKSQFVANVSHEIRTPMNGIMGMTRLLLATPLNPQQRDYAETVARSADALMHVINDLLDFSKIEAGRMTIEHIDFDLAHLLRDIIDLYAPRADAKNLALRLECHDALPTWVRGDPLRIRQILLNLLDNALKFTQHGEVRLGVQPLADDHATLRFTVSDTGIGMSPQVQARIFTAFAQGDGSVTRRFGGTGLGLTICRQLAELMGGRLELDSAPGVGSQFHLTLPLPAGQASSQHDGDRGMVINCAGARILVAEDNPVNQKLLTYMLEALDIEVLMTADGKAAHASLSAACRAGQRIDLVLMDVQMPEWDGLTATRAIRASARQQGWPYVPILALTANAMTGFETTCREAGMDGLLTKPLQEGELIAALARWLPACVGDGGTPRSPPLAVFSKPGADFDAATEPAYARERLCTLCRNDAPRMVEMLQLFITSSVPLLDALAEALARADAAGAARHAHQLRGAAAYLGAQEMARLAQAVEDCVKSGPPQACQAHLAGLQTAFASLRNSLEDEIKALAGR